MKTNENVKIFVRRLLKEFSNKQGNKKTLNDFLRSLERSLQKNALQ